MSNINVLVVEDEAAILTLIRFTLEQAGFNVTSCGSVEEARPHLLEKLPDVVLLDWMLPEHPHTIDQAIAPRCPYQRFTHHFIDCPKR